MGRRVQSTGSVDNALKTRRERNRQAQQNFRKRQQVVEGVRRQRLKHLEDTVDKLNGIVARVCDDVLTLPEVVSHPGLLSRLQGSMTEALDLAQSVAHVDDARESLVGSAAEELADPEYPKPELQNAIRTRTAKQQNSSSGTFTESLVDTECTRSETSANTEPPVMTLPFGLRLSATNPPLPAQSFSSGNTKSFPVQLVEATLSRACSALGDPGLPQARLNRAFGSVLSRHCTRKELLRRIRWLLAPGRSEIYSTAGFNWRPLSARGFGALGSSVFPSISDHGFATEQTDTTRGPAQRDELLTAVEVSSQLESLGATFVRSDTIELLLAGDNSYGYYSAMSGTSSMCGGMDPRGVRITLNSLVLMVNLSSVAECAGFGPVYPRSQIAKAVEASVVFAWNN